MIDLSTLTTERRNTETFNLDQMSVHEALYKMNQEDQKVAQAVTKVLPEVEPVTNAVIQSFKQGGRLIYMGAGTSGRLGVLDAAE
ncbi:MAG: N-acetylmuramic acid 6-phosphate etherase, partial [Streptococcus sp.]|nr:N-acetylmuramic acid 6-phosphate etherase [Streptococcus sp.]